MAAYHRLDGVEVTAGADVNPQAVQGFCAQYQIPQAYTDWRELLRSEQPEVLSVCTWEDSHAEIVTAAARGGVRAILCEKPMAMNLAEADAMLAACEEAGTVLAIGHMRRYNPHYMEARRLIEEGAIGEVDRMWAYMGG
jgi:predicted dehydrogenase